MGLSIFNSEHSSKRIVLFASALLILILLFGVLNIYIYIRYEMESENILDEQQWLKKVTKDPAYSVLLIGDSRTYRGINPVILEKMLHLPTYNAGLSGGGMNTTMFRFFENNKMSPEPGLKIIVLGITPFSLVSEQRGNKHLNSLLKKSKETQQFQFGELDYLSIFFKPINNRRFKKIRRKIFKKEKADSFKLKTVWINGALFHGVKFNQKWYNDGLNQYREGAANGKFSQESLSDLCTSTRRWTERGILVFGFRPPTSSQMEAIENQLPHYSEQRVKTLFEKAGGIYLAFPKDAYQTYDASHLNRASADRFSKDLAEAIKHELIKRNKH